MSAEQDRESGFSIEEDALNAEVSQEYLLDFINAIDAVVDECRVHVTEDGLNVKAVDPANVAIVDAELNAEAFQSYDAKETKFGINTRVVKNILECFEDGKPVNLSLETTKKLVLSSGRYSYTYAILDPDVIRDDPTIPDMDLTTKVDLDGDRLTNAVEFCNQFAQKVALGYDEDNETLYLESIEETARGVGTDDGEFVLPREDIEYVHYTGEARSLYSLDYFTDLTDALPEGETVTVEVGEEFPMTATYGIAPDPLGPQSGRYLGEVTIMQAPRIASN